MLDKIHMSFHEIGLICERKDHKTHLELSATPNRHPLPCQLSAIETFSFHSGPAIVHLYKLNKK